MKVLLSSLLFAAPPCAQNDKSVYKKQLTGEDLDTGHSWSVAGTDLGISYILENESVGYLFDDAFSTQWPEDGHDW